ncbi:LOW QUALITY PROTEIN: pentatricopeptide repeat-containing protein At1g80150, mitochondrial [Dioscorea cayenensis subsp. rotundata]|uniref:LOW QUALITY PROTEIN: pentatricopeptide repeat-containing protein At1g80150, mitochondrial n=1 Tax=Dioscorea cayennensis subsp. rotundata TaxID=55577 RepID=A0AB40B0E1_DIOCR|nr:LOW QUALITY PROTEIN: pentatricopeptide repeat-containing protein At1g80150, mitochondrial [Dioscorea cayenensis subsp. rotundata]
MLSLRNIRRVCAAIDTVVLTVIAANLSKLRARSDLAAPSSSQIPESFPTIASCAAAIKKKNSYLSSHCDQEAVSEPALIKIKKERDPEKLFRLFQSNASNRLVVENRFVFEDTVSRLAGARRLDLVEQLLEYQKALPQGRREGFIVRIIMLYGKAGMPDHALKTFDQMHLFGCPRTVKSFNATLQVLSQARMFDKVHMLFHDASVKYGIELDDISYNIIVKSLCELGCLNSAFLVMVGMEKAGIKPDVVTYTTLMAAAYKCNHREIGDGLWNLMVLKRCSPNLATFNVRIQYLINRRRGWQANDLMHKMMSATSIKPDELTYNLIIKGFCSMGELEMAKRVFNALHGRGCKPNSRIYQTMVHYLCKAREFDLAFRLCKDSMEKNWFPSMDTIHCLLKGLMEISKDRNAREIMKLIRGRVPPYSAGDLEAFTSIVSGGRKKKHL